MTQQITLIEKMAAERHLDKETFYLTIKNTVMPSNANKDQLAAYLMTADKYGLDPIRQMYAFANKSGGISTGVTIDGWIFLANSHPMCAGYHTDLNLADDGTIEGATCTIHRKDWLHPYVHTEYFSECRRDTAQWKQMPARMMKHKAFSQAARYAFAFSLSDEDEARDATGIIDITPPVHEERPAAPRAPRQPPSPNGEKPKVEEPPAQTKPEQNEAINPETGEIFEPEEFLTELDTNLAAAADKPTLQTIWADHDVATVFHAPEHKPYLIRAHDLLAWHDGRIQKEAAGGTKDR